MTTLSSLPQTSSPARGSIRPNSQLCTPRIIMFQALLQQPRPSSLNTRMNTTGFIS